MSRLSALLVAAAMLFNAERAHASPFGEGRVEPRVRWDLDSRLGFGYPITTAQSFLGLGSGLALGAGRRFGRHPLHLELGGSYYAGTIASASNTTLVFWSRSWSTLAHFGFGYEFEPWRLLFRPELLASAVFVSTSVKLGAATRRDLDVFPAFGAGGAALYRFLRLHAGVVGHALFVPSRVAAPILEVTGVFGLSR